MHSPFWVSIKCPECGAPARFLEGAYTFKCSYCSSVLRIKKDGVILKYVIPPRMPNYHEIQLLIKKILTSRKGAMARIPSITQIKTIYKPFWYFKGMVYYTFASKTENDTLSKTWYYSFQANPDFASTFHSLSVRTEVLSLEPFDMDMLKEKGIILPVKLNKETAYRNAEATADINLQSEISHTVYKKIYFIGEHFFIIYYPVVQVIFSDNTGDHTFMIDGISKSYIEDKLGIEEIPPENDKTDHPYPIKLISHRCQNCGHDLPSRDFDIFFYCHACDRLWLLKDGEYYPQRIKILEARGENCIYIPFWRFEVDVSSESTDTKLRTIGDLSIFMKLGRYMLRNEDPKRPIRLYVPALVTRNARALLKLAAKINRHQKALPIAENGLFPYRKILNASLPKIEAEEMLSIIVFSLIGRQDRKALDFYNDFKVTVLKNELIWYPFEAKDTFLIDHFHQYTFPKKSMDINVYG